jgi:hypothetical protein
MKRILLLAAVIFVLNPCWIIANVPYISIRSQATDSARDIVGITDKINLYDMENLYVTGAITLEGTRSYDSDALAHCLFGAFTPSINNANELSIGISGSQVPNRNPNDWLADYFGLSTTYQSRLFFKPRVTNFIIDFSAYIGLDEWVEGLYFWAHAPIVMTRWNLINSPEEVNNALPLNGYAAGYFAPSAVTAGNLVEQASNFFSDLDFPNLPDAVTFEPLAFARFSQNRLTKTALAEIQMALGYNFILCQDYYLGFNFRVYAPTGNKPKGIYAFEPICGNGKHWEVGAGLMASYTFWRSEDEESTFGFYLVGNFTHQCRATQTRTFDIIGKPNSRYMLAEKLGTPVTNLYAAPAQGSIAGATVPAAQFKNAYAPVANLTTLKVNVSSAIQADITALFNYTACGLSVDLGYNFWARSCEKISLRKQAGPTRLESGNVWALKGDASVYGFVAANAVTPSPAPGTPIALSATESAATINTGTNVPLASNLNAGVDNAQFAFFTDSNDADQIVVAPGDNGGPLTQMQTSNDPIFLSNGSIDFNRARTSGMSHKIFAHLSYSWNECEDIVPFIGVGGKAEFGPRHGEPACANGTSCALNANAQIVSCSECRNCQRCNLSEWGVWIKGGLFFS